MVVRGLVGLVDVWSIRASKRVTRAVERSRRWLAVFRWLHAERPRDPADQRIDRNKPLAVVSGDALTHALPQAIKERITVITEKRRCLRHVWWKESTVPVAVAAYLHGTLCDLHRTSTFTGTGDAIIERAAVFCDEIGRRWPIGVKGRNTLQLPTRVRIRVRA